MPTQCDRFVLIYLTLNSVGGSFVNVTFGEGNAKLADTFSEIMLNSL